MNRRVLTTVALTGTLSALGLGLGGPAMAANPPGTGQPSQSCGSDTAASSPDGFNSAGFAHAETVYAGSDGTASATHSSSVHAVSQYDVACFQVSRH
jgi:hypothetical protein